MSDFTTSAFISYSRKDSRRVKKVEKKLRKKIKTYMDDKDFTPGQSVLSEVAEKIELSDFYLVFITEYSLERPWVKAEIDMAHAKEMRDQLKGFIVPVIMGDVDISKLPLYIAAKCCINLTSDYEAGIDKLIELLSPGPIEEYKEKIKNTIDETQNNNPTISDSAATSAKAVVHSSSASGLTVSMARAANYLSDSSGYVVPSGLIFDSFLEAMPESLDNYYDVKIRLCAECNTANPKYAKYCLNCGTSFG